MVPALPSSLRASLGVTRVTRLTGLDRSGVEVAAAVRPRGHVLQVCNGKGESLEQAAAGAVLEAAELWCAERPDPARLRYASLAELSTCAQVWGPEQLGSAGAPLAGGLSRPSTRLAWCEAADLETGAPVWVPAQALHCPRAGQPSLGPAVVRWTSNGMGAHPHLEPAARHALLEAIERDQLARALPEGWTRDAVRSRLLIAASLAATPKTASLAQRIEAGGFRVFLFDLTPRPSLGLPVAGALLVDAERGPVPLAAGYACALSRDEALSGALLEAAQSRLTDVHGAREDVALSDTHDVERLRGWCEKARPRRNARAMPQLAGRGGARGEVRQLLGCLRRAGHRAAMVDLAPESLGVHVVKAIIPTFQVSELL
jgi:ribosomal protein S12 methylthiotransferase accessory factor